MPDLYKTTAIPKIAELWRLVGNTPMVRVSYRYRDLPEQEILVKCEQYNMTGSIKDRMALYILQKAYETGKINPGDKIVEATSGNTGIAFAAIGRALGHPVKILMPDWLSTERRAIISSYGAEIQLVSKAEDGFLGSIKMANAMQYLDNVFLPKQFENRYNVEAHEQTTGCEIDHQLLKKRIRPDAFVAGVGTGGTIMGVGNYLRAGYPDIKIFPIEPAESPTLSTGRKNGSHRIQGISDEFIPAIVNLQKLDTVIAISDGDAIIMAQRLGRELGLAVGISSGCNLLGAIQAQRLLGNGRVVITVFPDSNKKYLSTDLFKEEPVKPGYLSPYIKLTGYSVLNS
ncbi:PLP-dependent cysteine synthase family protein [Mucilaginibacter ximonensis]|uniref:PLP-dependent cysteine synthase family protein n=1 Tax=Mucilaginibacter ximonensis TaxID=538021 RepID=A0ABW5Y9F0_9SPHI